MTRPSKHQPLTKSYAIDQIEDVERLRRVAHRMWEALAALHDQTAHVYGVLLGYDECAPCRDTFTGGADAPCERYRQLQRKISDGFGSV